MTGRPNPKRSVRRVAKPPANSATLDGSSLMLGDAFSIDSLLQVIDRYRAFSFDVFDTLVTRIVDEPKYVFDLVGSRLRVPHFRQVRMNAEIAARAKNRSAHHCDEVNLLDIYSEMNFQRFSREMLIEHELQAERDVLRPNVGVCRVVDMLAAAGKRVIATSDTYFSGEELASLLAHCGIKVDAIYTSADHKDVNAGKFNCLLFRRVAQDEGLLPGEILHLGNDRRSDYENALMAGLHAIHLRAPREVCFTRTAANLHRLHVLDVSQTLPSKILLGSYIESHINGPARLRASLMNLASATPDH
jgi:predicted HAD superfamily hydrolase